MFKTSLDSTKKIRVFPQGLAVSGDELTSFVLFKDKKGNISFPVWCPMLPLGFVEGDYNVQNPYEFTHNLVEKLGFTITECIFDDIKSDEQMASLCIEKIDRGSVNSEELKSKSKSESKKNKLKNENTQLSFLESNLMNTAQDLYRPVQKIAMKAFEALAICSPKKDIIFSATEGFIQKTRDVAIFEKSNPSDLLKKNSFLKSRQKYLM